MITTLQYSPGQTVTIFQEVLDGYGVRTNDGYIPVVNRIFIPTFAIVFDYPKPMNNLDIGLYYFQFSLPSGALAVGSYFVDVIYMDPVSLVLRTNSFQIICNAPYGIYCGTTS